MWKRLHYKVTADCIPNLLPNFSYSNFIAWATNDKRWHPRSDHLAQIDYWRIKCNLRSPEFLVCYYSIKSIINPSWTEIGAYCTRNSLWSMIITFHMKQTAFRHVVRRHKCDTQWLLEVYQFNGLALSFLVSSCSSFIHNLYLVIHSTNLSGLWSFSSLILLYLP